MNKAIMKSVSPQQCERIARGEQTILLSKTAPNLETPFKCYIYQTYGKNRTSFAREIQRYFNQSKVIGEFVCDRIDIYGYHKRLTRFGGNLGLPIGTYNSYLIFEDEYNAMCLTYDEVRDYGKGKTLYGLHISDLAIYDKPKELRDFKKPCPVQYDELYGYDCLQCDCLADNDYGGICTNFLTRPPKGWCYVEEL